MAFFDSHLAIRLSTGFLAFSIDEAVGRPVFNACLEGSVEAADIDALYDSLFPPAAAPTPAGTPEAPDRGVRVAVRTSYKGLVDARIAGETGTPDKFAGVASFPAVIVDLVDDQPTASLGHRRHVYTQECEVMIVAKSKVEVRALHLLLQEMLNDSKGYFAALGYSGGVSIGRGSDLRPADGLVAGLAPNLLGVFQRYMRVKASITRTTPHIFSVLPTSWGLVSLHHVDQTGDDGIEGEANPVASDKA